MWRPTNWEELKFLAKRRLITEHDELPQGNDWLEAGADAILSALKAEGLEIGDHTNSKDVLM